MQLIDWIIVAAYFLLSVIIGVYYSKRAGKSVGEFFFVGQESSMVACGDIDGCNYICR
ncbi:hypothetical protein JGI8_00138 [Candidatus Kryptonium thompsonii]|uniref:Solute:Na+ symporter, SSS family n=1 Tax=Candidatus Kryptonium thompsonii TaxID=1633631 RepID=A0ABP2AWG0_9BACT|nr:hypothetical protein JGI8_00138 [Candidatus Kryptonium thompsoni]